MTKHPIRWDSVAFGLLFLAIAGNWAIWKQDLLTGSQLSLTASGVLISLGLIGIASTLWRAKAAPNTNISLEGTDHEETDPQH